MTAAQPAGEGPNGPGPGRRVRGSATGVPLMALFDLLGRRWALTCLWSLRDGPRTFREIQAVDDRISPSSLNRRLQELRDVGLVVRVERGYALSEQGLELLEVGRPLVTWSWRWAASQGGGAEAGLAPDDEPERPLS